MFITQHYAAFSGWPDTRVLLLLRNIEEVNRVNTLYYVPNALSIVMKDRAEYFFGSFIDREQCYANLISLSDVGKHMASLPGYDESAELRNLEFGYQTRNNLFGESMEEVHHSSGSAASASAAVDDDTGHSMHVDEGVGTPLRSATPSALAEGTAPPHRSSPAPAVPSDVLSTPPRAPRPESAVPAAPAVSAGSSATVGRGTTPAPAASTTPITATPPPAPTPAGNRSRAGSRVTTDPDMHDADDGINLRTLFERSNISLMQEKALPFPAPKLWSNCWLHGKGYG
jgi:hypothetical protein